MVASASSRFTPLTNTSKRPASDSPSSPPQKRNCASSSAANAIQRPQPLSINSILRSRNRHRLYVRTLHWQPAHLTFLKCQFIYKGTKGRKPAKAEICAQDVLTKEQHDQMLELPSILSEPSTELKTLAISDLLKGRNFKRVGSTLEFRFNGHAVDALETDGNFSDLVSTTPCLAYLDLKNLASRRDGSIQLPRSKRPNAPAAALREIKLKRIQPEVKTRDPFIVAVLVALAQEWRHRQETGGLVAAEANTKDVLVSSASRSTSGVGMVSSRSGSIKVHVLALPAQDTKSLYFYTAYIPFAFLDQFDMPSKYFPNDPVDISYFRLPLNDPTTTIWALNTVIAAARNELP